MVASRTASRLDSLSSRPIVVVTHKRSGTHLTLDLLRRHFRECDAWKWWGENESRLYLSLPSLFDPTELVAISERRAVNVLSRCPRPTVKTHRFLEQLPTAETTGDGRLGRYWVDWLHARGRQLYVYRDGRDVLCSLQLLEAKRDRCRWLPISEFIRQRTADGVPRAQAWARHVERGLAQPAIVPLRFEDLKESTRPCLDRLARQLELTAEYKEPLLPSKLRISLRSRLARRLARRPQSTAILGRPRGLELVRWRQAFSREDREFFHRAAGDTLIRLGY
ncbi:MAG: hypothetical protein ACE5EG_10595, partial [Thermoanaerobaculia bacterium]